MGVKIPLMKVGKLQEWRGISQGQVVGPDVAFRYISKSMQQTLPAVMGALTLLADSFTSTNGMGPEESEFYEPSTGADTLHANAYNLYTKFRPSTAGEWGKKSTFFCGKALALRRGKEEDLDLWEKLNDGQSEKQQSEIQAFEQELRNLVKSESEEVEVEEDGIKKEEE